MPGFPWAIAGLCLFLLFGCAGVSERNRAATEHTDERRLVAALLQLSGNVDPVEAETLAEAAVAHSNRLAEIYRVVRPAIFHNMLVNAGLRERGLCIHWTHDLMEALLALELKTIELRWGVACPTGLWGLEHNSVVACAVGDDFHQGLVLDPWRDSGRLFWCRISTDRYEWRELPLHSGEPIEKRYPCPSGGATKGETRP